MIIVLPVLPLVLASLIVVILMRFANLRRHKDLLAVIGSFVAIFFAMGINLMTAKVPVGNEQDFFVNMLQSRMGLINWIGSKFPPSIWATLGITDTGLRGAGYIGLYTGISILLFIALMLLGNALFYKSVLAGQEVSRKRKALVLGPSGGNNGVSGLTGGTDKMVRSPVQAVCRREWKLLVRTPIYLINGMSGVIIGPMMILFMMMSQGKSGSSGELEELYKIIQNPAMQLQATLVGLAFVVFSAGMNLVASTSISREGNTCWISKIIPVSPTEQMAGKLKQSMEVCLLSILATTSILFFYLKFAPGRIAVIIGISVLASLFLQAVGLMIDLARPKLVWNNPQEAIKQNMNGFLGMIAAFALIGAGALVSISMIKAGAPEWLVYLVLGGIMAVLAIAGIWMLFKKADSLFARIEV